MQIKVKQLNPLVHCITNPISIHQCANAILAVGGRPIMAEHPKEVAEITASAQSVMLNLGNITDARMESIAISAKTAQQKNIPALLDLAGIACSAMRRDFVADLLKNTKLTVLKGNYSEILALYNTAYRASGVDAAPNVTQECAQQAATELANTYNCIVLASGKTDIVTDGKQVAHITSGTPRLAQVTGTGCLQSALCAAYLAAQPSVEAVISACTLLGKCGEMAQNAAGNGSFYVKLMDCLTQKSEVQLDTSLYFITDSSGYTEQEFLQRVERALQGGVTLLQLREKEKSTREYIELAKKVHQIAKKYNVPLLIDDRADVALAMNAEGVHLGQSDMPIDAARRILGNDKIIGATAKTVEQAVEAYEQGADYLGVGAIYPTTTKVKTVLTSTEMLNKICHAVPIPVNAIGGLNKNNLDVLKGIPIAGICAVSAIMKADDPCQAACELKEEYISLS